jgi:hypothetical protein
MLPNVSIPWAFTLTRITQIFAFGERGRRLIFGESDGHKK